MLNFGKRFKTAGIGIAITAFLASAPAYAHDGWSQTNAPIIAQGEVAYIDMLLGNHSNEHKSYRIAGQWSPDSSSVFVVTPDGRKVDITSSRFYTGEAATETEPAVNNGFVATFSSSSPGAYIISVEGDSVFAHGDTASRTLRSAKSFVAVSDVPVLDRVKALTGFAAMVSPDRAELVPMFNPSAVKAGDEVSVKLLLKGEPLADTEVTLIRRSNSEASTETTDADGIVTFAVDAADYYLVRAKPTTNESKEGEYDSMNYEATMTFIAQNGKVSLTATAAAAQPYVYVNGKQVDGSGVTIANGTTMASNDFVRSHLDADASYEGSVALRAAADEAGAVIEYLPPVGETRAAILIYTK